MSLLTTLIVKNSHILARTYYIFLGKRPIQNLKGFHYEIWTTVESSYQVRQILAPFCKLVALILG